MGCFLLNMRDYACMCVYIYIYSYAILLEYLPQSWLPAVLTIMFIQTKKKTKKKQHLQSETSSLSKNTYIYIYIVSYIDTYIYIYIKHPPSPLTPRNLVGIAHGNHIQGRIATTTNLRQIHRKAQAFAHPIHLRSSTRRVNDLMVGWPQGICFFGGRWNCWWQPRNPAILKPSWGMVVYLPLFTTGFKN